VPTEARQTAERRGRWAEALCRLHLRLTGWSVIGQRHRQARGTGAGEIDIIARRGHVLAFIEVKARETGDAALEAVSTSQQERISRGAAAFLAAHPQHADCTMRFDVMAVRPWRWPLHVKDAWRIN
jgi:putative endonuclease